MQSNRGIVLITYRRTKNHSLTLEKPGFTRLLEVTGGVIYDTTRITSKEQVALYDTSQWFSKYWSLEKSISKFQMASYMTP